MYSTDLRRIMPLLALTTPASMGVLGSSRISFLAEARSGGGALAALNGSSVAVGLATGAGKWKVGQNWRIAGEKHRSSNNMTTEVVPTVKKNGIRHIPVGSSIHSGISVASSLIFSLILSLRRRSTAL